MDTVGLTETCMTKCSTFSGRVTISGQAKKRSQKLSVADRTTSNSNVTRTGDNCEQENCAFAKIEDTPSREYACKASPEKPEIVVTLGLLQGQHLPTTLHFASNGVLKRLNVG